MEWMIPGLAGRECAVFGDDGTLTLEPVTASDLVQIAVTVPPSRASVVWSSGLEWYFEITVEGIALLNIFRTSGWLCRKRSARFIEMFLDAPASRRLRRKPKGRER
jgi:hypothetical protein